MFFKVDLRYCVLFFGINFKNLLSMLFLIVLYRYCFKKVIESCIGKCLIFFYLKIIIFFMECYLDFLKLCFRYGILNVFFKVYFLKNEF